MEIYLTNGSDIDAAYNDDIAISHNGSDWNYYKKAHINSVKSVRSKSTPKLNKGRDYKTTVEVDVNGEKIKFDCQDLSVGAGVGQWASTDVDGSEAGLDNVKTTINNWL